MKDCDVVIYDRLISEDLLEYVKADCEKIYVGKSVGNHTWKQEEINDILVKKGLEYKNVVRLKGGDPFVFGRGGEEVLALEAHEIPYEVVPGVTSAIAAATYAGIPITHRGLSNSFHVITGHTADREHHLVENFDVLARLTGTLVFLMGMGNLPEIVQELLRHGKEAHTPVAIISNGTTKRQRSIKGELSNIVHKVQDANIKAPAIIVIGNVAALDMMSNVGKELSGVRIGLTGTKEMNRKLTKGFEALGASVEILTTSYVQEYQHNPEFDQALLTLGKYQWIVFTSSYGIQIFFQRMLKLQVDYRKLAHVKFAVVGKGTKKALAEYGYMADYMPEQFSGVHLAKGLCEQLSKEERVLIPRAKLGSEELSIIFEENHMMYDDIKIYEVVKESKRDEMSENRSTDLDYITFASSSGVHDFIQTVKGNLVDRLNHTKVICIGDVTEKTLKEYGYHNAIIAKEYSAQGLVEAVCEDRKGEKV